MLLFLSLVPFLLRYSIAYMLSLVRPSVCQTGGSVKDHWS